MDRQLEEARFLGCEVTSNTFDGGQSVTVRHPSGVFWSGTHYWGDGESRSLQRFLNGLPWPQEDDPRVEHEGVHTVER